MAFRKGDTVVHPEHGAAVVEEVREKEFLGEKRKYLVLRGYCEAVGRPYDSVLRTYFGGVVEFGESVQTREEYVRTVAGEYLVLHGDPKGAVAHYRALVGAGVRYFIVVGLDDPKALRLFAEQVVPAVARI